MDKYIARRWDRAKAYTQGQVVQLDDGSYWSVQSLREDWHTVSVRFTDSKLSYAHCGCADHGECQLHGVPVCKHTLAAAIAATTRDTSVWYREGDNASSNNHK